VAGNETDVITGSFRGREFSAGHISGTTAAPYYSTRATGLAGRFAFALAPNRVYPDPEPGSSVVFSENVVRMKLSGLLPELRLLDRDSTSDDYGMALPPYPTGIAQLEKRWDIQTPYPEFARQLLTEPMVAFLCSIPPIPCTMVVRNGELITCGDPEGSFESISARLAILDQFANLIPPSTANRASPEVAGRGAHKLALYRTVRYLNAVEWDPIRT